MKPHLVFLAASGAAVVAAIAAGVLVIGGPGQARLHRLDAERVQALERIDGAVNAYYRQHHALPPSLPALAAQEGNFTAAALRDPESGQPYAYGPNGPASYRLCAVFAARSDEEVEVKWAHGRGPVCFARTVGAERGPGFYQVSPAP